MKCWMWTCFANTKGYTNDEYANVIKHTQRKMLKIKIAARLVKNSNKKTPTLYYSFIIVVILTAKVLESRYLKQNKE